MQKSPPPSRAEEALDTSPPLRGVEDGLPYAATPILHPAKRGGGAEQSEAEGGNSPKKSRSRRKPGTTERARTLRWVENSAEGMLWLELKGRRLGGHQFVRQHPIGPYFADFCCRKTKLVIELDGSQHADSTYDRRRDEYMRAQGYSVLRFWSHEVQKQRGHICEAILAALEGRLAENVAAFDMRFVYAGAEQLTLNQQVQPLLHTESFSDQRDPST
jgi:very-short-patch-repair endonuclease